MVENEHLLSRLNIGENTVPDLQQKFVMMMMTMMMMTIMLMMAMMMMTIMLMLMLM